MNLKEKREKFDKFYRENEHEVYKAALYFTRHDQAAVEVAQKAFYHVYLVFERLDMETARAYALRAARNWAFNWMRDFKIAKEGNIEDYYEDVTAIGPDEIMVREFEKKKAFDLAENILSALYEKNQKWYDAIVLAYYLEISQEDLARQQGVDKYVISSRLYRAKKWIRANYREEYDKMMESFK